MACGPGPARYRIPFPFEDLTREIADRLGSPNGEAGGIAKVLIPMGRSLQRDAAKPHYFEYPRAVAAVVGTVPESDESSRAQLRDQLSPQFVEFFRILAADDDTLRRQTMLRGVEFGLPVLLVLRHPRDAVISMNRRWGHYPLPMCLKQYVAFHKPLVSSLDKMVVSTFEESTLRVQSVFQRINQSFGKNFKADKAKFK